jgi:hypothetical protein
MMADSTSCPVCGCTLIETRRWIDGLISENKRLKDTLRQMRESMVRNELLQFDRNEADNKAQLAEKEEKCKECDRAWKTAYKIRRDQVDAFTDEVRQLREGLKEIREYDLRNHYGIGPAKAMQNIARRTLEGE